MIQNEKHENKTEKHGREPSTPIRNCGSYGTGTRLATPSGNVLRPFVPTICEMKIDRFSKFIGVMIGPEGSLHQWTALHNKIDRVCSRINHTVKSPLGRLVVRHFFCITYSGICRLLSSSCHGLCTSKRFHADVDEDDPWSALQSLSTIGIITSDL